MSQATSTDEGSILRVILIAVLILIAIPFVMMPMMGAWGVGHVSGLSGWDGSEIVMPIGASSIASFRSRRPAGESDSTIGRTEV